MEEELLFSGKDLEQALDRASDELDMQKNFLDYEVVEEKKKKLFGLIGEDKVRIKIKDLPSEIKKEREIERRKNEKELPFNERAIVKMERLVGALGLDLEVEIRDSDDKFMWLDLQGEDRKYFLRENARALNDLQFVFNLMVYQSGAENKKVKLDSEGFREKRKREVKQIARKAAEKVRLKGKKKKLSEMNPYERRIVHIALNDSSEVTSYSVGRGFMKKVVVAPEDESNQAESAGGNKQ